MPESVTVVADDTLGGSLVYREFRLGRECRSVLGLDIKRKKFGRGRGVTLMEVQGSLGIYPVFSMTELAKA